MADVFPATQSRVGSISITPTFLYGAGAPQGLVNFCSFLFMIMSVGSPLLSPEFAARDTKQLSFLNDQSITMDSSSLFDLPYEDENSMNPHLKRATFTPTRVKPTPRAWQRKPATPFAPRSEAQKIWKRVPLQNVTSAINASWRKTNTKGDGIMRPVKKLRIGANQDDDDKENSNYVAAKWDTETSPDRSPRRRAPAKHRETDAAPSDELVSVTSVTVNPPFNHSETTPVELEQSVLEEERPIQPQSLPAFDIEQESEVQSPSDSVDPTRTETERLLDAQLLDEADSFLRLSPQSSPTVSLPTDVSTVLSSPFTDTTDQHESMSPALDGSQHPQEAPLDDIQLSFEVGKQEPSPTHQQQLPTVASQDPDDTSYLQDFLLRSRASKAAKLQTLQTFGTKMRESPSISSADVVNDTMTLKTTAITQVITPTSPPPEAADDNDAEDETDAKASSPCRRSSRLTRLPRPQKPSTTLPSSIALRRLNGTEFISMQREAQSLAVTTRGNTRKNRGGGIGVQARLIQLKSEADSEDSTKEKLKKSGKAVTWAEILARYQEYTVPVLPSSAETQEPEPTPPADEDLQETTTEPEPKKSSKKVRSQRKESVGSVNGTPAPKRSIEILLEDAARTTGQSVDAMSQQTEKRTRSRTRS